MRGSGGGAGVPDEATGEDQEGTYFPTPNPASLFAHTTLTLYFVYRKLAEFGARKSAKKVAVRESFSWIFGRTIEGKF